MQLTSPCPALISTFIILTAFPTTYARPGESYKTSISGFTARGYVGWQEDSSCVDDSYASLSASENTYRIRGDGKQDPSSFASAHFSANIVSECTNKSAVLTYVSVDAVGGDGDPYTYITVDSGLSVGSVNLLGYGSVYSEECLLNVYEGEDYVYYYYTNCTEISYGNQTLSLEAKFRGQGGSPYNTHSSYSEHSRYGTYSTRSQGRMRDATVVSVLLTFDDGSTVNIPANAGFSYSRGSLGIAKTGEASFYSY